MGPLFPRTLISLESPSTLLLHYDLQLAEAILTEGASPIEDTHSIMLNDTRTSRRSGDIVFNADDERQFLVGKDEDDEDDQTPDLDRRRDHQVDHEADNALQDEVRSFGSSASMDSDSHELERQAERSQLRNLSTGMVNEQARMSHLDVNVMSPVSPDGDGYVAGIEDKSHSGSLAAKAGIIIVRRILLFVVHCNSRTSGYPQYLHRHASIYHIRYRLPHLFHR